MIPGSVHIILLRQSHILKIIKCYLKNMKSPNINIDYLMVGLRYGFCPRVTDVISQTSEVRASDWYHISHEWIKPYLKPTMILFIYHIPTLSNCKKHSCTFLH